MRSKASALATFTITPAPGTRPVLQLLAVFQFPLAAVQLAAITGAEAAPSAARAQAPRARVRPRRADVESARRRFSPRVRWVFMLDPRFEGPGCSAAERGWSR